MFKEYIKDGILYFDSGSEHVICYTLKSSGNMAFQNNKNNEDIIQNRKNVASKIGVNIENFTFLMQNHTANFVKITGNQKGKGLESFEDGLSFIDAAYTFVNDIAISAFFGDCTPIFLYTDDLICLVHSGIIGDEKNILDKVLKSLIDFEGIRPDEIKAIIGPASETEYNDMKEKKYSKKEYNKNILVNNNIPEKNIFVSEYYTTNNDEFYSVSKDGLELGRSIAIIYKK